MAKPAAPISRIVRTRLGTCTLTSSNAAITAVAANGASDSGSFSGVPVSSAIVRLRNGTNSQSANRATIPQRRSTW